jgi:hypothetical protein
MAHALHYLIQLLDNMTAMDEDQTVRGANAG